MPSTLFDFGPFRLDPGRRMLLNGEAPVRLGQRALDILIALVTHAGEVVDKATLNALAWPGTHVDEANLRAQIATLRRALGDGVGDARYIVNIPGRGYSFVAPVGTAQPVATPQRPEQLPIRLTPLIGHEPTIAALGEKLRARRFVTIVGAGGIGKTSVAVAVARSVAGRYADGVCFVDFGALTDGALVVDHVAAALGAAPSVGGGPGALVDCLAQHEMLLLFDSCEPVVTAVAPLAEAILRAAPRVDLLVTSRERMRAEGEWAHRLASLSTPPRKTALTIEQALEFEATRLFVERVQAASGGLQLQDVDLPLVIDICWRLEGIPLAIELAATRVPQLGLATLAERLDDRFALLMRGRRTALPRHQTLQATLDWSYQLLPPRQQALLCRLAVFRGGFSRAAAIAVGRGEGATETEALGMLAELTDKSLVTLDPNVPPPYYRCLDATRAYLSEKLAERGEAPSAARAHAGHFLEVFRAAGAAWASGAAPDAPRQLGRHMGNLRVALDWAFGPDGDAGLGIVLTIAAVPVWSHLSLMEEGTTRLRAALAASERHPPADPRQVMQLAAGIGALAAQLASPAQEAVWTRTLRLAEQLDDTTHRLRALAGLYLASMGRSHRESLAIAQRYLAIAQANDLRIDIAKGERMIGFTEFSLGDQTAARRTLEGMLRNHARPPDRVHLLRFAFDDHVLARAELAMVLWLQGEPWRALSCAMEAVREAKALDHDHSLFVAAAMGACPIAILLGGLQQAPAAWAMLQASVANHPPRMLWATCFRGLDLAAQGETRAALALLREGLGGMAPVSFARRFGLFHAGLAECLLVLGEASEALAVMDAALGDALQRDEHWFVPELLRLRGLALEALDAGAGEAEAVLRQAIGLARVQAAPAWELRAATSLARLLQRQARFGEAYGLLAAVVARFAEGTAWPDLDRARQLLGQLPVPPGAERPGAGPNDARRAAAAVRGPGRRRSMTEDPI